jgi:hypothetical protein
MRSGETHAVAAGRCLNVQCHILKAPEILLLKNRFHQHVVFIQQLGNEQSARDPSDRTNRCQNVHLLYVFSRQDGRRCL